MWRESACWSGRKNSKDTGNAAEISEGRGHLAAPLSACQKTYVEMNPLKFWRGSSRGRQPASSGIECPERLAWQGVQRAQRGLFRRTAAGKYRHLPGVEKVFGLFRRLVRARPFGRAPLLCKLAGYARSSSPRMASNTASPSWHMTSRTVPSSRVSSRAS